MFDNIAGITSTHQSSKGSRDCVEATVRSSAFKRWLVRPSDGRQATGRWSAVLGRYKLPPEGRTTNAALILLLRRVLRLADARRLTAEALLFSAALSLLFVVVYGTSNLLASKRQVLGACFFAWELQIPFVPALIVPYMSIDLFFVASFFLCADTMELRGHARRIALAILIAGFFFLAFPLTVGYQRPDVSGWTGWMFDFLWSFDKPHNLVPSLHVTLASLLWPMYARHTHGRLRWLVHGWFALIIASPLLTWQHHVVDVAAGAMLGQVCMFAFPERRQGEQAGRQESDRGGSRRRLLARSSPNLRIARFYAMGSAALGMPAIALGSWFWLLLWPAGSLALIAIAYGCGNSAVFRKANGKLPISTRAVLGPYLCGMFVRLLICRRRVDPWIEAAPEVYRGRLLTTREAQAVRAMGVAGVLDMTAEHAEALPLLQIDGSGTGARSSREIAYLNVAVLDLTEPSREQLDAAVAFISEHAHRGGVYVHCALGVSRSVAAVAAYTASKQAVI